MKPTIPRCSTCKHYPSDNTLLPPRCMKCLGWKPNIKVSSGKGQWYAGKAYEAKETA